MQADVEGAVRGMDAMTISRETIGELFPEHGIVKPERYEEALDALGLVKEQVIALYAKAEEDRKVW
jgi:hypothetical protein